ncbi:MAG: M81 family metallopeptidase [Nitriliruptoraceae bacterium]
MSAERRKRVLIAYLWQESNAFAPGDTDFDDPALAEITFGDAILDRARGSDRTIDGMLDVAEEADLELIPVVEAKGGASPPVTDASFDRYATVICDAVAATPELDGILLGLHGAMSTPTHGDAEGELLRRVRAIVGPDMPIAVASDLHAHVTSATTDNADIVVGYHTHPHIDQVRTGRRATELLVEAMEGRSRPTISMRKIRMITSAQTQVTDQPPHKILADMVDEAEARDEVLSANLFCSQPWLDVPDHGWTAVIVTDAAPDVGQALADDIGRAAWDLREAFRVEAMDVDDAIDLAVNGEGTYVFGDGADSTTAGGAGDGNLLLAALLRRDIDVPALMIITDPDAAATAIDAGVGATVEVEVGGALTPRFFSPVRFDGTVLTVSEGEYISESGGRQRRQMGPTAVVVRGGVTLVITTVRARGMDPTPYLSVGLDPADFRIVQSKSAGAYRGFFSKYGKCIDLDVVGPAACTLERLPYEHVDRPLWPLDDVDTPW